MAGSSPPKPCEAVRDLHSQAFSRRRRYSRPMPPRTTIKGLSAELSEIVGPQNVLTESRLIEDYRKDMADYEATPAVVVRPSTEAEVRLILRVASRRRMPLVARGAGTSLTGAAVLQGGIVLDMQRFKRILKVDPVNYYVHVEAGVVLDDLNDVLRKEGFFFPPDPASSFLCTVGGAIAEGSGGMRCVRYGTMRDWVLALRVVLANGLATTLGEPLAKNRVGYDLVHLMIGSEGTLGVVTEAFLKILPLPSVPVVRMLVTFDDWPSAGRAIQDLRQRRIVANLMEFMDRETVAAVNAAFHTDFDEAEATLLVELEEPLMGAAEEVFRVHGARRFTRAADEEEAERFYFVRSHAYLAVKDLASGVQIEDVTVPIERLAEYLALVKEIGARLRLRIPTLGHAGDGNVHPTILFDRAEPASRAAATAAFEELCRYAIRVGGTVTGEHGIGIQKVSLMREQMQAHGGAEALRLMKGIKRVFDPNGVLNPGKYVDAA
ncbi:MAG: FAD-binding protein [Methanobacteriota archaeon]|nr:MAG: FAD-binding protein [Euryarchaeota archaeon]